MESHELLDIIKTSYQNLEFYRDRGTAQRVGITSESVEFETFYASPNKLKLTWQIHYESLGKQKGGELGALYSDGSEFGVSNITEIRKLDSLADALAIGTPGSAGACLIVPTILMPTCVELNNIWYALQHPELMVESEQGNQFYHLKGYTGSNDETEIWVKADDYSVRRVKQLLSRSEESASPKKYSFEYNFTEVSFNKPIGIEKFRP